MTRDEWTRLLAAATVREVSYGAGGLSLFAPDELDEAQVGYAFTPEGEPLVGEQPGDWSKTWLVVGRDDLVGDPIFVDVSRPRSPVFTAEHGVGKWNPVSIADSAESFLEILKEFQVIAAGREHPVALDRNPLPDSARTQFLDGVGHHSPASDHAYWEALVEEAS